MATDPPDAIDARIRKVRRQRVMLDADLAELYCVELKALNQAVRRNRARFPRDFMFQLDEAETDNLRSQIVTSSSWGGDDEITRKIAALEQRYDAVSRRVRGDSQADGPFADADEEAHRFRDAGELAALCCSTKSPNRRYSRAIGSHGARRRTRSITRCGTARIAIVAKRLKMPGTHSARPAKSAARPASATLPASIITP
jgi:hypothetical protein